MDTLQLMKDRHSVRQYINQPIERNLSMFIFNLQKVEGIELKSHTQAYEFMHKQGKREVSEKIQRLK